MLNIKELVKLSNFQFTEDEAGKYSKNIDLKIFSLHKIINTGSSYKMKQTGQQKSLQIEKLSNSENYSLALEVIILISFKFLLFLKN